MNNITNVSQAQILDDLTSLQQDTPKLDNAKQDVAVNSETVKSDDPSLSRPEEKKIDSRGLPEGGKPYEYDVQSTELKNNFELTNKQDNQRTEDNIKVDSTELSLDNQTAKANFSEVVRNLKSTPLVVATDANKSITQNESSRPNIDNNQNQKPNTDVIPQQPTEFTPDEPTRGTEGSYNSGYSRPVIAIEIDDTILDVGDTTAVYFRIYTSEFGLNTSSFTLDDIQVTGGSLNDFEYIGYQTDGQNFSYLYIATFTKDDSKTGGNVFVDSDKFYDYSQEASWANEDSGYNKDGADLNNTVSVEPKLVVSSLTNNITNTETSISDPQVTTTYTDNTFCQSDTANNREVDTTIRNYTDTTSITTTKTTTVTPYTVYTYNDGTTETIYDNPFVTVESTTDSTIATRQEVISTDIEEPTIVTAYEETVNTTTNPSSSTTTTLGSQTVRTTDDENDRWVDTTTTSYQTVTTQDTVTTTTRTPIYTITYCDGTIEVETGTSTMTSQTNTTTQTSYFDEVTDVSYVDYPEPEKEQDNNGHGNNQDGEDDSNPGQGSGGPNDNKDTTDEDEGANGNTDDDNPGSEENNQDGNDGGDTEPPIDPPVDPEEPDNNTGQNPGNDKDVGGSPFDGETGDSGQSGNGQTQDGIDTNTNNPPGQDGTQDSGSSASDNNTTPTDNGNSSGNGGPQGNNGFGNGDQESPGGSEDNNNAENNTQTPTTDLLDTFVYDLDSLLPNGNKITESNLNDWVRLVDNADGSTTIQVDLHSGRGQTSSGWIDVADVPDVDGRQSYFDPTQQTLDFTNQSGDWVIDHETPPQV